MSRWKWFSDKEAKGLTDDLMFKLNRFREYLGQPVYLTETVASGGSHVADTAHASGQAIDGTIRPKNDPREFTLEEKLKIAWAAGRAGFERVGVYTRHVHLDVDKSKPSPALWTGVSK